MQNIILSSQTNTFAIIVIIVVIFLAIGGIVFYLRKRIPGIAEYEEEDQESIAKENLSRILMDVEEEKKQEEDNEED